MNNFLTTVSAFLFPPVFVSFPFPFPFLAYGFPAAGFLYLFPVCAHFRAAGFLSSLYFFFTPVSFNRYNNNYVK